MDDEGARGAEQDTPRSLEHPTRDRRVSQVAELKGTLLRAVLRMLCGRWFACVL